MCLPITCFHRYFLRGDHVKIFTTTARKYFLHPLWARGGGNRITFCLFLNWSHPSHDFKPHLCWERLSPYPLSCSNPSAPKVTIHLTSNWAAGQYLRHNLANKDYWLTCIPHTCHSSGNLSISVTDTISSQLLSLNAKEAAWSPWTDSILMVNSVRFTFNIVSLKDCFFPFPLPRLLFFFF